MSFWLFDYIRTQGHNFGQVTPLLYRGSAPDRDRLKQLQEGHAIRRIIDLRDTSSVDELESCDVLGLEYLHRPMSDKSRPDAVRVDMLLAELGITTHATYVHCEGGRHRTGLVVACYRVRYVDQEAGTTWTKDQAWYEAHKFGYYRANGHGALEDWFFGEFSA